MSILDIDCDRVVVHQLVVANLPTNVGLSDIILFMQKATDSAIDVRLINQ